MYYLYFLIDPTHLSVKYIGITKHMKVRLYQHIHRCNLWEKESKKGKWIRSLLSKRKKPIMVTVHEYDNKADAIKQEYKLIRKHIKTLTNSTLKNG